MHLRTAQLAKPGAARDLDAGYWMPVAGYWMLDTGYWSETCSVGRLGQQEQAEPAPASMPARSYFAFASLLGYEGQVGWRRSRGVLAETANATGTACALRRRPKFQASITAASIVFPMGTHSLYGGHRAVARHPSRQLPRQRQTGNRPADP